MSQGDTVTGLFDELIDKIDDLAAESFIASSKEQAMSIDSFDSDVDQLGSDLQSIINAKLKQTHGYYRAWVALQTLVRGLIEADLAAQQEVLALNSQFRESVEKLERELARPWVALATTGTTSGGKSSLVNLLCGAEIMPVGVREVSVGAVFIDHHPTERHLSIPTIDGLPDKYSGEWDDLSDEEIQEKLSQVMKGYLELREQNIEPPAPIMRLTYPTRIGKDAKRIGLPNNVALRIIDLPGLKFVGDEKNKEVIREQAKRALCLVTIDSEESDPVKQQELLDEVVNGIRDLQSSPARMIFLLNKIDVFRRHHDWKDQMDRFISSTRKKIRESIAEALPEHESVAMGIEVQPLSSLPALYAYQAIQGRNNSQKNALNGINKTFPFLVPDEILNDLHRDPLKWDINEKQAVSHALWKSSYGEALDANLRSHIQRHLPELLLPHLLAEVRDSGREAFGLVAQIAHGLVNATDERYKEEKERLKKIRVKVEEVHQISSHDLINHFDLGDDGSLEVIPKLTAAAQEVTRIFGFALGKLAPLYDWYHTIGKAIDSYLRAVSDSIEYGHFKPKGHQIQALPPQNRKELETALEHLQKSGYREVAGEKLIARSSVDRGKLREINMALNMLAKAVTTDLELILERTTVRESQRIRDALQYLLERHAESVARETHLVAPDLVGLSYLPTRLSEVPEILAITFNLKAGFEQTKVTEKVKVGEKDVVVGTEKRWYTLWLWDHDVTEKQPVYEERRYDAANIPSLDSVFANFVFQAKDARVDIDFYEWLQSQMEAFLSGVREYQEKTIQDYDHRLQKARQMAEKERDRAIARWEPVAQVSADLISGITALPKLS